MTDPRKQKVKNRGVAPDDVLTELTLFGQTADDEIFVPNKNVDIYSLAIGHRDDEDNMHYILGPWESLLHRRAAMLEVLRVLAGFESSWNWREGVDTTNKHSQTHIEGQETGIFQVSANSMDFGNLREFVIAHLSSDDPFIFIDAMKRKRQFAIEYCARLLRFTTKHHGPLDPKRGENSVYPWLRRDSMEEFQKHLV